jgi:hypothetical protein
MSSKNLLAQPQEKPSNLRQIIDLSKSNSFNENRDLPMSK